MADHPTDQPSREGERWWTCKCGSTARATKMFAFRCPRCRGKIDKPLPFVPASTLQAAEAERDKWKAEEEKSGAALFAVECVLDDLHPAERANNPADWLRRALRAREARWEAAEAREDALRELLTEFESASDTTPAAWFRAHAAAALLSTQEPTR